MKVLRQFGTALFDFTMVMTYLYVGPVIATGLFGWMLHRLAFQTDGSSIFAWTTWLAISPLLYLGWLVWFLAFSAVEAQFHGVYMHYHKPRRATPSDGFYSWLMLNASLCMYLRARFILSLPLVDSLLPIHGLRYLVFLSYARSAHLGFESLILGNLFDPDITFVGEGAIVGSASSVIAHSFTVNPDGSRLMITSPITIGARAVIGGAAQIHPGVQIGQDAVVEPASYVSAFTQIGDGEVWGGNPARFIRMRFEPSHAELPNVASQDQTSSQLDEQAETILRQIVAKTLHRPLELVTATLSAQDTAAWDSLAQIGMAVELQKHFGITLTNQESFRLRSMSHLREVVARCDGSAKC